MANWFRSTRRGCLGSCGRTGVRRGSAKGLSFHGQWKLFVFMQRQTSANSWLRASEISVTAALLKDPLLAAAFPVALLFMVYRSCDVEIRLSARWRAPPPRHCSAPHYGERRRDADPDSCSLS